MIFGRLELWFTNSYMGKHHGNAVQKANWLKKWPKFRWNSEKQSVFLNKSNSSLRNVWKLIKVREWAFQACENGIKKIQGTQNKKLTVFRKRRLVPLQYKIK
jgi:hypothetical protein